jgi:integrase
MKKYILQSVFSKKIDNFVQYKRSLGYKYNSGYSVLCRFDRYCTELNISEPELTKEIVETWSAKKDDEHPNNHNAREVVMRQFGIYLVKSGENAYILPEHKFTEIKDFQPYIYSQKELSDFFKVVDNLQYNSNAPYAHEVMPMLFRLLYGCGLRISEALQLKKSDVNFDCSVISIWKSKGDDSRLVPVAESLSNRLKEYLRKMSYLCPNTPFVFPGRSGEVISHEAIYHRFRKLLFAAGISHGGRRKGPRIHDFRHTFAVNSLEKMVAEGMDIYCALPILSTYLGHKEISSTEEYVRMTSEAHDGVISQLYDAYGNVVPLAMEIDDEN